MQNPRGAARRPNGKLRPARNLVYTNSRVPRKKLFWLNAWAKTQAPCILRLCSLLPRSPSTLFPTAPRQTHFPSGSLPLPPSFLSPAATGGDWWWEFTAPRSVKVAKLTPETSADSLSSLSIKRQGILNAIPARIRTSHEMFRPSRT